MADQSGTVQLHRVLRAPPERVYKAFVDANALERWLPPYGFTGKVHEIEVGVGVAIACRLPILAPATVTRLPSHTPSWYRASEFAIRTNSTTLTCRARWQCRSTSRRFLAERNLESSRMEFLLQSRSSSVISDGRSHWKCWQGLWSRIFPMAHKGKSGTKSGLAF